MCLVPAPTAIWNINEHYEPTKSCTTWAKAFGLDNITRDLLNGGTLKRYIDELSVTGLTSNPTIFDHAIKNSLPRTTGQSARSWRRGKLAKALFFDLALDDLMRAADLFRPVHDRTNGVDGGFRWRCRHCWRMTRPAPSPPPRNFPPGRTAPTCSSRSPAPRKVCRAIEEADLAGVADQL